MVGHSRIELVFQCRRFVTHPVASSNTYTKVCGRFWATEGANGQISSPCPHDIGRRVGK